MSRHRFATEDHELSFTLTDEVGVQIGWQPAGGSVFVYVPPEHIQAVAAFFNEACRLEAAKHKSVYPNPEESSEEVPVTQ